MPFLERWQQQFQERVSLVQADAVALRKEQQGVAEQLRIEQQRHRQRLDEWAAAVEQWQKDLQEWMAQLKLYGEQNAQTKKTLLALQETEKRLRQEHDEMKELSRLNDERRQKEMRAWKGESDKQWANFLSEAEFRWNERHKLDTQLAERLQMLEAWRKACEAELKTLDARLVSNAQEWDRQIRDFWATSADWARRQMAELQKELEEIEGRTKKGDER